MATMTPEMFPGDPVRAAEAIYEVVASDRPRHWVILGSDAYRLIGAKLDKLRAEYDAGREMGFPRYSVRNANPRPPSYSARSMSRFAPIIRYASHPKQTQGRDRDMAKTPAIAPA